MAEPTTCPAAVAAEVGVATGNEPRCPSDRYTFHIKRFTLIDTAEESEQWIARARSQWCGCSASSCNTATTTPVLAMRVINKNVVLGQTDAREVKFHTITGWSGVEWDYTCGVEVSLAQNPMLLLEVVCVAQSNAVRSSAGSGSSNGNHSDVSSTRKSGKSSIGAGRALGGKVVGLGVLCTQFILAEERQFARLCVHLFPMSTSIEPGTVHAIAEVEVHSSLSTIEAPERNFMPLEYNYGCVRVSCVDFYYPPFLLHGTGEYIVSNVLCAMNMTESSALAMQLVPRGDAASYLAIVPEQIITVRPQQRVYFTVTWILIRKAYMGQLQMQLRVNGVHQVSAPIIIRVHMSIPQHTITDSPYHYWINTTCVTNRSMLSSQELPLLRAALPVHRFLREEGPMHQTEGMLVAFDKDRGKQILVRANGAPVQMGQLTQRDSSLLCPYASAASSMLMAGIGSYIYSVMGSGACNGNTCSNYSVHSTGNTNTECNYSTSRNNSGSSSSRLTTGSLADADMTRLGSVTSSESALSNASFVMRDGHTHRTGSASAGRVFLSRGVPLLDLRQKTCLCTIVLGTIYGFPPMREMWIGESQSFQVSVTVLDTIGWQAVHGETMPSYRSTSGCLRWGEHLTLRKWPGAGSTQFVRLNLTEIRAQDGDETPIGACLVSLPSMHCIAAHHTLSLPFYVYETYSLYDDLASPSLLMRDISITLSDVR